MSAQMTIQTANYPSAFESPRFSFLAKPPPQKRRPAAALPPPPGSPPPVPHALPVRKRSNANCSILAWATHVQPGSPAPRSPHRRLSITSNSSRRSSISRLNRRPSISHNRAASGSSFVHIIDTTPVRTPSTGKFDLTTLGYASVFVQFPKTPTTPSPYLREYRQKRGEDHVAPLSPKPLTPGPLSAQILASIPIPPIPQDTAAPKRKGMKRFRSLSILRPRSSKAKSQAAGPSSPLPVSPTKTSVSVSAKVAKAAKKQQLEAAAAAVAQRKHTKYPASKSVVRAPPTLANELALMQFADGGSIESHARRVMEAQAHAARGHAAGTVGVADIYRDGQGGVWWDADEEMEYAPLLGGEPAQGAMQVDGDAADWELFADGETDAGAAPLTPLRTPVSRLRAATRASVSTQDSDLDPARLLPLPEHEDDRALASARIGGPGMSVLALPARPRRAVPHLRAAPAFLVDPAAFAPRSPVATAFVAGAPAKTKVRRRPAPLKLASSAHAGRSRRSPLVAPLSARRAVGLGAVPSIPAPARTVAPSPGGVEKTRREFLEDSFVPVPMAVSPPPVPASILIGLGSVADLRKESRATKRKGVRELFGIARRSD